MTVVPESCQGGGGGGGRCADDRWPPGFRFHPTDEELVLYYLKRKMCRRKLKLNIIRELDVYKWDPEELPGQSMLNSGDRQWFFFSPRERKYPNGQGRSNRATLQGYWKATGKDRNVTCNSRNAGVKKTLVFYRGRAPTGGRTDWVMHEYTLDQEELNRCPNVKEYYALYKVYKKSGPGPKNGEQYGAPFREEDWPEDDCAEVNNPIIPEIPAKQPSDFSPVANVKTDCIVVQPLNDLEEFMKQIAEEPFCDQSQINAYTHVQPQVGSEEEAQSTLVDASSWDASFPEPAGVLPPSVQWHDNNMNFDCNQSSTLVMQAHEASEVTSAPKNSEQQFQLCDTSAPNNSEQQFQLCEEDFLEIDDLIGPEPTFSSCEPPAQNIEFDDFDGLSQFDLYHDAQMFLNELGSVGQETVSHSHINLPGIDMVNQLDYQSQHLPVASHVTDPLQAHLMVNHVDYQLQPQFFGADQMSNQLCANVQSSSVVNSAEPILGTVTQPTPGAVHEPLCNPSGATENQSGNEDDAGSWFSSTLWSFVESIPTTPASASENPLVNKALVRMSSFSRMRINTKTTNTDTINGAGSGRRGNGSRGFLFLSIFGALCAILWLFIGTVRVLGRSISS